MKNNIKVEDLFICKTCDYLILNLFSSPPENVHNPFDSQLREMEISLSEPGVKGHQKELWEQSEQTQPSKAPRSVFSTGIHCVIELCLWTSSVRYWFLADSHHDLDFRARNSHAGNSCWKTINWASQSIYCEMKYLLCTSVWLHARGSGWGMWCGCRRIDLPLTSMGRKNPWLSL